MVIRLNAKMVCMQGNPDHHVLMMQIIVDVVHDLQMQLQTQMSKLKSGDAPQVVHQTVKMLESIQIDHEDRHHPNASIMQMVIGPAMVEYAIETIIDVRDLQY